MVVRGGVVVMVVNAWCFTSDGDEKRIIKIRGSYFYCFSESHCEDTILRKSVKRSMLLL